MRGFLPWLQSPTCRLRSCMTIFSRVGCSSSFSSFLDMEAPLRFKPNILLSALTTSLTQSRLTVQLYSLNAIQDL